MEDRPINDVVFAADRRINPPATRWKGLALRWDEYWADQELG
jgi:hypothetical protein